MNYNRNNQSKMLFLITLCLLFLINSIYSQEIIKDISFSDNYLGIGDTCIIYVETDNKVDAVQANLFVLADLSDAQPLYDNGTHGDITSNDHIFSYKFGPLSESNMIENISIEITVTCQDSEGISYEQGSGSFGEYLRIDKTVPEIESMTANPKLITPGSVSNIQALPSDNFYDIGYVKFLYRYDFSNPDEWFYLDSVYSEPWSTILSADITNIPELINKEKEIKIKAFCTDIAGNKSSESEVLVKVDGKSPSVEINSPSKNDTLGFQDDIDVVAVRDEGEGISDDIYKVKFQIESINNPQPIEYGVDSSGSDGWTAVLSPYTLNLSGDGWYRLYATAIDTAGNEDNNPSKINVIIIDFSQIITNISFDNNSLKSNQKLKIFVDVSDFRLIESVKIGVDQISTKYSEPQFAYNNGSNGDVTENDNRFTLMIGTFSDQELLENNNLSVPVNIVYKTGNTYITSSADFDNYLLIDVTPPDITNTTTIKRIKAGSQATLTAISSDNFGIDRLLFEYKPDDEWVSFDTVTLEPWIGNFSGSRTEKYVNSEVNLNFKIISFDLAGNYSSSGVFTIYVDGISPKAKIIQPQSNEIIPLQSSIKIDASTDFNDVKYIDFDYKGVNAGNWETIDRDSNGKDEWSIDFNPYFLDIIGGNWYFLRAVATDSVYNRDSSPSQISVYFDDTTGPIALFTDINGYDPSTFNNIRISNQVSIKGITRSNEAYDIKDINVLYYKDDNNNGSDDDGNEWIGIQPESHISESDFKNGFNWNTSNLDEGYYLLKAIAEDYGDNVDPSPEIVKVQIDHTIPAIEFQKLVITMPEPEKEIKDFNKDVYVAGDPNNPIEVYAISTVSDINTVKIFRTYPNDTSWVKINDASLVNENLWKATWNTRLISDLDPTRAGNQNVGRILLRVIAEDVAGNQIYDDISVIVDNEKPTAFIYSVNSDDTPENTSINSISKAEITGASADNDVERMQFSASLNNGITWESLDSDTLLSGIQPDKDGTDGWSVLYNVPLVWKNDTAFFKVVATDSAGNTSESGTTVTPVIIIDTIEPSVSVSSLSYDGGNSWIDNPEGLHINSSNIVIGTNTKNDEGIAKLKFQYRKVDEDNWVTFDEKSNNPFHSNINISSNKWNVTNLDDGEYLVRVIAEDLNDNIDSSPYPLTLFIDRTAPTSFITHINNITIDTTNTIEIDPSRKINITAYSNDDDCDKIYFEYRIADDPNSEWNKLGPGSGYDEDSPYIINGIIPNTVVKPPDILIRVYGEDTAKPLSNLYGDSNGNGVIDLNENKDIDNIKVSLSDTTSPNSIISVNDGILSAYTPDVNLKKVLFQYKKSDDTEWKNITPSQTAASAFDIDCVGYKYTLQNWSPGYLGEGKYLLRAISYDAFGNKSDNTSITKVNITSSGSVEQIRNDLLMNVNFINNNKVIIEAGTDTITTNFMIYGLFEYDSPPPPPMGSNRIFIELENNGDNTFYSEVNMNTFYKGQQINFNKATIFITARVDTGNWYRIIGIANVWSDIENNKTYESFDKRMKISFNESLPSFGNLSMFYTPSSIDSTSNSIGQTYQLGLSQQDVLLSPNPTNVIFKYYDSEIENISENELTVEKYSNDHWNSENIMINNINPILNQISLNTYTIGKFGLFKIDSTITIAEGRATGTTISGAPFENIINKKNFDKYFSIPDQTPQFNILISGYTRKLDYSSVVLIFDRGTRDELIVNYDGNAPDVTISKSGDSEHKWICEYLFDEFNELSIGKHNLYINAKDQFGVSASTCLNFIVDPNPVLSLENVHVYPNPCSYCNELNMSCIAYQLSKRAVVNIKIFDFSGDLIKIVTKNGLRDNGYHDREYFDVSQIDLWDGTDKSGQKVANGVYLGRIIVESGNHKLEKVFKIAVLR